MYLVQFNNSTKSLRKTVHRWIRWSG